MSKKLSHLKADRPGGRGVISFALAILLVFSVNSAFGQSNIVLEGERMDNRGIVDALIVNDGGEMWNTGSGFIGTATINDGGHMTNWGNNSTVNTVTINEGGSVNNRGNGFIIEAILDGGRMNNYGSGNVSSVTINNDGYLANYGSGDVGIVTINNGTLNHYGFGNHIGVVTMYDGEFLSRSFTDHVVMYGGHMNHYGFDNAYVSMLSLHGGDVLNRSRIENLTYIGGHYSMGAGGGVIGNLDVTADSSGINWGFVNNLSFDSNGHGLISLTGHNRTDHVGFGNIQVTDHADLRYGGLSLDLSSWSMNFAMGTFDNFDDWNLGLIDRFGDGWSYTFSWESLLGTNNVEFWDDLRYVELVWGYNNTTVLFDGNAWLAGWGVSSAGITTVIPEPATLAIVGLGLAGLGLARRRGRKK